MTETSATSTTADPSPTAPAVAPGTTATTGPSPAPGPGREPGGEPDGERDRDRDLRADPRPRLSHEPDRVAVVVIHGMGQQRPMGTLRQLVHEYIQTCNEKTRYMWSVADRYDRTFELQTFVVPPEPDRDKVVAAARAGIPLNVDVVPRGQIDFYEGYWASDLRGTKLAHLLRWIKHVLMHVVKLRRLPLRLAWVWAPLLLFVAGLAFLIPWLITDDADTPWYKWALRFAPLALLPFAFGWAITTLGDVARYIDVGVDNVAARREIRKNLVGLLGRLHDDGRYRRIVLIGHSLGGVVAYDALRLLWAKRSRDLDVSDLRAVHQELLDSGEQLRVLQTARTVGSRRERRAARADTATYDQARTWHRDLQRGAFDQLLRIDASAGQSRRGHAWLISDLVTLGSPIAYPDLLLTQPGVNVCELVRERFLPTSPPQLAEELPTSDPLIDPDWARIRLPDGLRRGQHVPATPGGGGHVTDVDPDERWGSYTFNTTVGEATTRNTVMFHHGAVFALTRWTNVYATADFVGNEIPGRIGAAVTNVRLRQGWAHVPYFSHTQYWLKPGREEVWNVIDGAARDLSAFLPEDAADPTTAAPAATPVLVGPAPAGRGTLNDAAADAAAAEAVEVDVVAGVVEVNVVTVQASPADGDGRDRAGSPAEDGGPGRAPRP